jgi:hypothetical protein
MTNRRMGAVVVAAALGLAACGDDDDDGAAAPGPQTCTPPAAATTFFVEDVHPLLQAQCTPCHGDAAPTLPKFGSADRTTAYDATRAAVNTTTPAQSALLRKGDGQVAHGGGDVLDPEHVATLTAWIEECAQDNSSADPTPIGTVP